MSTPKLYPSFYSATEFGKSCANIYRRGLALVIPYVQLNRMAPEGMVDIPKPTLRPCLQVHVACWFGSSTVQGRIQGQLDDMIQSQD